MEWYTSSTFSLSGDDDLIQHSWVSGVREILLSRFFESRGESTSLEAAAHRATARTVVEFDGKKRKGVPWLRLSRDGMGDGAS